MADSVISFLLQNLSQQLAREANLLFGVDDKVTSLRNELAMIDAFLRYAERKKISNEILDEVIDQIKQAAHESEDVIDNFIAHVTKHRRRNILGRMIHVADHAKMLRKVAGKIEMLRNRINEIQSNKIKYDIEDSKSTSTEEDTQRWELIRERRRNVEEDDVVGLFHDSREVIQRLRLTEGHSHSRRTVVAIIGMGGLGKTTLSRKIYNDNQVKNYFGWRAWVYVSNYFRPRELLIPLLESLYSPSKDEDVYSWTENQLKRKIGGCLQEKTYLVVLDDIWKAEDWDRIEDSFPDAGKGSRILITSRSEGIASHAGCAEPYELAPLSLDESWELLRKKVFRGEDVPSDLERREDVPSDLERLGREIAKSCHGLPLSIVVLSGFLADKEKSPKEWSKVIGHVNWYLARDETPVKDIVLQLSYDSLPRKLKPCFLYFGVFPEDFEIHVRPLIQKWVAEGFIQQCETRNPEDVAEDYLNELVDRSLIQVASRRSDGGVKTCRIHDLLRDLCLREGKKDKLFEVCTGTNVLTQRITKPRRLSIHCSMPSYASSENFDHSCTRSLICFDEKLGFTNEHWKWLVKGFKLARVLDIGKVVIRDMIPINIDALIHLRYLSISVDSYLEAVIPNAICNLSNLETLDLVCSSFLPAMGRVVFPSGMWKLKRLRYIRTSSPMILSDFSGSPTNIMNNLLSLSCVDVNEATVSLIQKGMFPSLQKLGLNFKPENINNEEWQRLWQGFEHFTCLNTLKLVLSFERLARRVESVAFPAPAHITKLTFVSEMQENWEMDMMILANFTNLQILKLGKTATTAASRSGHLKFSTGWFPQLRVLKMKRLGVLNWELANGAMPRLERLVMVRCQLEDLPGELWSLTTLRQVQVLSPFGNLIIQALQNLEMKDGVELIIRE